MLTDGALNPQHVTELTLMRRARVCCTDNGGGDTRQPAPAGRQAGAQLRGEAAVGRRRGIQEPEQRRAQGPEALHQRHHPERLPPQVPHAIHQVIG